MTETIKLKGLICLLTIFPRCLFQMEQILEMLRRKIFMVNLMYLMYSKNQKQNSNSNSSKYSYI